MQTTVLPDDPQVLKALIGELVDELARRETELDTKHHTITVLEQQIQHLQLQIAVLRRARFGRRSEKLDQQLSQLELMLEELQSTHADAVADRPAKRDTSRLPY